MPSPITILSKHYDHKQSCWKIRKVMPINELPSPITMLSKHCCHVISFVPGPASPDDFRWWYMDTATSFGFLITWTIFPPLWRCLFGSHRTGRCVLRIRGLFSFSTIVRSGIASSMVTTLLSLRYSALPSVNMCMISEVQWVPVLVKIEGTTVIIVRWMEVYMHPEKRTVLFRGKCLKYSLTLTLLMPLILAERPLETFDRDSLILDSFWIGP